ncbi:protein phosphatase 1 regulatory subunit 3C-B-like isoform X1 [Labrus mixtus]|uniref:protein phosphatase 1 regulatory subunit 3C-B-like isoform X1 n=2 Tax=Labrus mixtus TaxID=508554 RepID=UPI0029C0BD3F|nr:protein phosphatase 1 regulatory subunit 3C-B-like isoform X1 [Labrus mixtus]
MNCTRVLHILNPRPGGLSPIMPVDMAMRICLASSPPLHTLLSNYDNAQLRSRCEPLRPCLTSKRCGDCNNGITTATTASTTAAMSSETDGRPTWPSKKKKKKKSVVFADSRGLALTAVHVFNEFEEDLLTELQYHLTEIEGATAELHLGDDKGRGPALLLEFTQPAADYLDLRNRLKAQQVCLETCSVQDRLLSGTVQVRNICFDKSVAVRITFDLWRSFQDVPGVYMNNVYGCPDTDTFSFSVLVPESLGPSHRVEFCVQYRTPEQTFWDNNDGDNYRLSVADPDRSSAHCAADSLAGLHIQRDRAGGKKEGVEFDPFGSPRTSSGIFPEWQSWVRGETSSPYW